MNPRALSYQSGISLVEAMVALLILTVGLIPVLAIITSSSGLAALIKNNLIAANLAQEGIEVVRGLRDANWFVSPVSLPFETGLIGTWRVEWDTNILGAPQKLPQVVGINPPLKFDATTGLYNYSTGTNTQFKRTVTISLVGTCACEIKVVSIVTWPERNRTRTIMAESHLFNWK